VFLFYGSSATSPTPTDPPLRRPLRAERSRKQVLARDWAARTVSFVQKHTTGRRTGAPDIAGDLERTLGVLHAALPHLSPLGNPRPLLLAAVADHLERSEHGKPREHVVRAILEEAHRLLEEEVRRASSDLARSTGITPAALRTRTGWNDALRRDGHGDGRVPDLEDLPGTLTVLAVKHIVDVAEARKATQSSEVYQSLNAAWDGTRTSGRSFDAVIDAGGTARAEISRIGWALITLEGRRHVNLIWHQANKLQRSFPDRDASELFSWGWLGLRTALRNYNPALGFAFSTYAVTRIVGSIRDGVRAENPVPKRLGTLARKVAAVENDLARSLGRTPTMREVGVALDLDAEQLAAVRRTRTPASIEEIVSGIDRNGGSEPDWLTDGTDTVDEAFRLLDRTEITAAMSLLPPEEAEAVRLLVLEDRTPTEARLIAGVTARQLRQRKERGLNALRASLGHLDPGHDETPR
jgi:RNA polymerase sigma factor for flagellar operon FliA